MIVFYTCQSPKRVKMKMHSNFHFIAHCTLSLPPAHNDLWLGAGGSIAKARTRANDDVTYPLSAETTSPLAPNRSLGDAHLNNSKARVICIDSPIGNISRFSTPSVANISMFTPFAHFRIICSFGKYRPISIAFQT